MENLSGKIRKKKLALKMKARFEDIRSRIKEVPTWHDENGTPRYGKFSPDLSPNIYAREVILFEIACQYCHQRFDVEMNFGAFDRLQGKKSFKESLDVLVKLKNRASSFSPIHYGDPPIHECPGGGTTMNCYNLRIKQFWFRNFEWKRLRKYEIKLETIK